MGELDGEPDSEEEARLSGHMAHAVNQTTRALKQASAAGDEVGVWFFGQLRKNLMNAWQRGLSVMARVLKEDE